MSETIKTNQGEVQESTPWDSLVLNSDKTRKAEYLQSEKGQEETAIEDTFDQWTKELDEMVDEGKISKEEAKAQQETMLESAVDGIYSVRGEALRGQQQEAQTNEPIAENIETKTEESSLDGTTFEVAPGLSKEAEFKRLTGEDWPGVKYTAESNGADEGDDYPIETWTIKKRAVEEKPEDGANQEPTDTDTPEATPEPTSNVARDRLNQMREILSKTQKPTSNVAKDRLNKMKEMLAETPEESADEPTEETAPVPEYNPTAEIPEVDTPESIEEEFAKEKSDLDDLDKDTDRIIDVVNGIFGETPEDKDGEEGEPTTPEKGAEEDLDKEKERLKGELDKIDKELEELEKKLATPLVAVDVDFTHDKHELARDLAERDLNEETAKAGLIKKLWKGTLFKKYYHKKYTREYIEEKRTSNVEGEELSVYDLIARRSEGAIKRFVLGATEDMRYIHTRIGEKRKDGTYDGEKLVEADEKTTAELKAAIEKFASANIPEGGSLEDLKLNFRNEIARLKAEARDEGRAANYAIDNYLDVAIQARERVEHGIAMERVMEGFKVYRGEARDSVRTEAHRDNLDKIINRLESGKIGQFVPAEVLAGAVSIAYALTQTGARALAGAGGGILVSSALAGLKERNRITEDRARMLRDVANGMEYGNSNNPKTRKYETKIAGTAYDLQPASELTKGIEAAMQVEGEGRTMAILQAIAEARVRIDVSDHESKDLISYSSEDKRGDERLALDMAVIRAEKSLSEEDRSKLVEMRKAIEEGMLEQISEKDQDFKHKRAAMAAKKAGKTLLVGVATFFASQEIMAAVDPSKIGILEKYGILKTNNNDNASETLLASGFGLNRGNQTIVETTTNTEQVEVSGDQQAEIARLKNEGFTETKIQDAYTEIPDQPNTIANLEIESVPTDQFAYDGWAGNNTPISDGNELRGYLIDGKFFSGMYGDSTMGNQVFNYDQLLQEGRMKIFLTFGDKKFELATYINDAGQLTAVGENGVVQTVTGETIKALGDNGEKLYKLYEIAMDNGIDANGVRHIIPFGTDGGLDRVVDGMVQKAVRVPVEHPAKYLFTKTIADITEKVMPRRIFTNGIFVPETARTGLGGPRTRENVPAGQTPEAPAPTPETPTQTPETPNPTPEAPIPTSEAEPAPETEPAAEPESAPEAEPTPEAPTPVPETEGAPDSNFPETPESVPEPESAPEAESTPETTTAPETEPTAETEMAPERREHEAEGLKKMITNNAEALGGEESANILTSYSDEPDTDRYSRWWDSLGDAQKVIVRNLARAIDNRFGGPDWGRAARRWILAQPE